MSRSVEKEVSGGRSGIMEEGWKLEGVGGERRLIKKSSHTGYFRNFTKNVVS